MDCIDRNHSKAVVLLLISFSFVSKRCYRIEVKGSLIRCTKKKINALAMVAKKYQTEAKVSRKVRLARKKPIVYGDARNRQVPVTGKNK